MTRTSQSPIEPAASLCTFVELLQWRALSQPHEPAYSFLVDGESRESHTTYVELDHRSRAIAAHLQSLAAGGECALLLYPPGLEFIAAFFGCLYAVILNEVKDLVRERHYKLKRHEMFRSAQHDANSYSGGALRKS